MKTEYIFDISTAQMVEMTEFQGNRLVRSVWCAYSMTRGQASMTVTEGDKAEREFFNHFGDDTSWPAGWYSKLLAPRVSRLVAGTFGGPKL